MRIMRIIAPWLLLLTFTCSIACGQSPSLSVEVFAEGGGSFLNSGPSYTSAVAAGLASADNGWQFAGNYGGGPDIVLQRHLALRLELRDYVTGQPSFITGTSHNIVPSVGIVLRLK